MPEYVLNRNHTHRSTKGHAITFVKGEPAYVPPHLEAEVIALGADRVDGEKTDPLADTDKKVGPTPDEMREQIAIALELIAERNDSNDFTGAGVPNVKAVERVTGFSVSRDDVKELWDAYKAKKAE